MFYFYVLYSEKDQDHYYGSTNDLKKRYDEHSQGKVSSTKYRRPLSLLYYEAYITLESVRQREKQVKKSGSIRTSLLKRITHTHP